MSGERMTDAALADLAKQLDGIADDLKQPYCAEIRKIAAALRARPQAVAEEKSPVGGLDWGWQGEYNRGWNDCRAALLAASQSATGGAT